MAKPKELYVGINKLTFYLHDEDGNEVLNKVLETAIDIASKKGEEVGIDIKIVMVDSDGISRFVTLDGEKYGKNPVTDLADKGSYSQGFVIDGENLASMNAKNETIVKCNQRARVLNGGNMTKIQIDSKTKSSDIKKIIENASSLISSFRPTKHVPICGNCGHKSEKLTDKCPSCKSTYII